MAPTRRECEALPHMAGGTLVSISRRLSRAVGQLVFEAPVAYVYDPLSYARESHERYLERWGSGAGRVLLLGMNPGPFGMAQTGVPFGDVASVRDFVGVSGAVQRPAREHPKRPITGFACERSEVSGTRLWGWARERFGSAERFFERFFVANYCPLVFMDAGGKNLTPDKLPRGERDALETQCDRALREVVRALAPRHVVGIGAFAEGRARAALGASVPIATILHPSPASPAANRGWAAQAERQLAGLGLLD